MPRSGATPDLLIADAIMPGMSGFEVARDAVASYPGLKILYLTGYTKENLAEFERGEWPPGKLLMKPIVPDDLLREIDLVLQSC